MTEKRRQLPESHRVTAKDVGRHEGGHWVSAEHHGFIAGDISIVFKGIKLECVGSSDIKLYRPIPDQRALANYLEGRIQVLLSGVLGEALNDGKVNAEKAVSLIESTAHVDFSKAKEHIHVLRNVRYPEESREDEIERQAQEIHDSMWEAAIVVVERHAEAIMAISEKLSAWPQYPNEPHVVLGSHLRQFPGFRAIAQR